MPRHKINPAAPIMAQLRVFGIPEHLPHQQAMVYRFRDAESRLLYVGVTVAPRGRWQAHKKAAWWPLVDHVLVELHQHERSALDSEVAAIKAENPMFNRRSAPPILMQSSCGSHEARMQNSSAPLPRVGGGVGVGVGEAALVVTERRPSPVDNPPPAACRTMRCGVASW